MEAGGSPRLPGTEQALSNWPWHPPSNRQELTCLIHCCIPAPRPALGTQQEAPLARPVPEHKTKSPGACDLHIGLPSVWSQVHLFPKPMALQAPLQRIPLCSRTQTACFLLPPAHFRALLILAYPIPSLLSPSCQFPSPWPGQLPTLTLNTQPTSSCR